MEGSFKAFKSQIPTATRRSPPYDGERSSEDETMSDDSGSKTSIRKKSSKQIVLPTKSSSATKGSVPRNKILRESSNFRNTHIQKSPNLDSKAFPKKSPSSSYSSDLDYEDQNSTVNTSSLKPYDPLTNYLSPRPKFLRYNPNRRREIFLHRENETRELEHEFDDKRSLCLDTHKSAVEDESSCSSSHEDSVEPVGDKIEHSEVNHCNDDDDEEEEEIEEFEEESDWSLRGAFRFLLVVAAMYLSTLYISSMNSPASSSSVHEVKWDSRDGNINFQNTLFSEILEAGNQTSLTELKMVFEDDMELVDTNDEIGSHLEFRDQLQMPQIGQNEGVSVDEFEATKEIEDSAQLQTAENYETFKDYPIAIYTPFVLEYKKIVEIKDEMGSVEGNIKDGTWKTDEDSISSNDDVEINPLGSIYSEDEELDIINSISIQIIWVSLLVALAAFLGFVFRSRKMRTRVVIEKDSPVDDVEKNKGFTSPSPLTQPSVAAPKEMMSYSSKKSKMVERIEGQSSSNSSVSQDKQSTGCLSYGSFTAEMKILKKEKSKDGEVNMVITTPVRRSSRLLNRGVISP